MVLQRIQLTTLKQFSDLFDCVKESINNYEENLKNNTFYVDENESMEKAYKRGETLYDKYVSSDMKDGCVKQLQ